MLSLEIKRALKSLQKSVKNLEERNEDVSIESLEGKTSISVQDIVGVFNSFRSELSSSTVSVDEMQDLQAEFAQLNERLTKQEQEQIQDVETRDKIEHLSKYIKKIEE